MLGFSLRDAVGRLDEIGRGEEPRFLVYALR
jgi:hypothetical protein